MSAKPVRVLLGCEAAVRDTLRRSVAIQPGFSLCGEASDPTEILAAAKQSCPDIVVVDLTPPYDAVDAIRKTRDLLGEVEVLGFVAYEFERTVREAWAAGARGLVYKVHAAEQFIPALRTLAEHKSYVEPDLAAQVLPGILAASQAATMGGRTPHLTPREREIVQLVAGGRTSKEIAVALSLSPKTVEAHRASILKKLNIRSASQMVLHAVRNHIIPA